MWQTPVGPLPAAVYWRRRWTAVAVAGIVLVSGLSLAVLPDGTATRPADPPGPAALVSEQSGASPQSSAAEPDATDTAETVSAPPCTNAMIAVRAEIDRAEYHVTDQQPELRLVVENTSGQPCVRDLDPVRQELVVWSEDLRTRLWSSNDCASGTSAPDSRILPPGQPLAFPIRWAGRTSAPGCPVRRSTVPPGSYQLRTQLDDATSPPTPFRRLP